MDLREAYEVLGLPPNSSESEVLSAFKRSRDKLESKLVAAPTDGLKTKYRRAIEKLEEAYEVIDLTEVGEDLPLIRPQLGDEPASVEAETAPTSGVSGDGSTKRSSGPHYQTGGAERTLAAKTGKGGGDVVPLLFIIMLMLGVGGGSYWYIAIHKPASDRLGTEVASQISELEVSLDALDRREQALERDLRNLEQRERDAQRQGTADEQAFYSQWRTAQEAYLRWYGDFSASHPARASLKTALQLQTNDLQGASDSAEKGLSDIESAIETAAQGSYQRVGQALIAWALEPQRSEPESWMTIIRTAHPEWIGMALKPLIESLSTLDSASPLPVNADEGLRRIRIIQGSPNENWVRKVAKVRELEQFLESSLVTATEWGRYETAISELGKLTGAASVEAYSSKLEGFKSTVSSLKQQLSGLENRVVSGSDAKAVTQLREWVGESDPDYRRHAARLDSYLSRKSSLESRLDSLLSSEIVPVSSWGEISQLISSLESQAGASASQGYQGKLDQAKNRLASLKSSLSRLDSGQSIEGDDARLETLSLWVGESDLDYQRWQAKLRPRRTNFTVEAAGIEMIWVNPGSFMMGSPSSEAYRNDNEGRHRVELTEGYWLGRYEVRQTQWQSVMGNNPSKFSGSRRPVEQVSWEDCVSFCQRLTERERQAGRLPADYEYGLPTEAQWEYACRAGTTTATAFGNSLSSRQANFNGNYPYPYGRASKGPYLERTSDVGSYQPNGWGFYDMHGNVWEWCHDWYGAYGGAVRDPTGPPSVSSRVYRGGSWSDYGRYCRSAGRARSTPSNRYSDLGFRVSLRRKLE